MAQALVSMTAEAILKKVLSLAAAEIAIAWGYEEKLTTLHATLDLIRAKLRDAERQKGTEAVMVWLKQLTHVVNEADDVLDEIHYEMLRREVKKRGMMPSPPWLKRFAFRREMGHKIENICRKLVEINKQANDLGLQNEQPAGPVPDTLNRETDPYLDEEFKIFGRENDELRIIQLLTQSRKEETLTIVPIVGMGGVGKTTLAKSIYNNPKIEHHFDVRAWLCVSVKVDVNTLLAKIYESLAREECKSQMRVNLITDLRNKLGSKRYLLVLDDVWDEERAHWDDFRSCMLKVNAESGSGILVTTRNLGIGTKAMSEDFHALQTLSDDWCWSIFRERAFLAGRSPLPELEEIGHEIVKKCRGLPLLVNIIGGMLRNYNTDKEKWLSIQDSKVWDLEDEGDRVQNSLKLSFDNLPSSIIKQCFAYCCMFKKDKVMRREELIRLWMAVGLVQADERRNKEAEDVGNDIFQILVSSSLFQDVKMDEYGYVTGCMHDLVHDLSLSLSKHENLCLVDPTSDDDIARIPRVKHLAMCRFQEDGIYLTFRKMNSIVFKEDMTNRTMHTLIFRGTIEKNISLQRFKCLRVLKFRACALKKINDSVGELVHLRYLDLSYTKIKVLPKSIGKLYHLQTLKLSGCFLKQLPQSISKLISLRHLMYTGYLILLGHKPIRNVGRLTSLRTLPDFRVGREKRCHISELGPLKHLAGELHISNLENISGKEDAAKADICGKKNLCQVYFRWSEHRVVNQNDKDVLEGLQPHGNLRSLSIINFYNDSFPEWVTKMATNIEGKWTPLHKLVKIELSGCSSCAYLPVLEHLPLLRDLELEDMDNMTCLSSCLGQGDNFSTGSMKPLSPSLRSLQLSHMRRLEKWIDAATTSSTVLSPVLEKLHIKHCRKIIHLDECHPHPLVSLDIYDCYNLVSIKSIQGLTSLEFLSIRDCPSLLEIPYMQNFEHHPLKALSIVNCKKLTSLPCKLFDCFSFLNRLTLGPFSKELHSFPSLQGIEKLRNHLRSFYLYGWVHWESIPEEIKHLTSLTELHITEFGMRELPIWLTNMSSIRVINFVKCTGLNKETLKHKAPREARLVFLDYKAV
ncbi:unnamed protein product [Lactuca virosa]|uniref:Disease resistance protein RGA3 n=1 Tax=Lactuca virosa TaxID=75947 RepID=A0AAU9PEJ0_9ASTR|nr:unnamed protein product [Lactuca virosa]